MYEAFLMTSQFHTYTYAANVTYVYFWRHECQKSTKIRKKDANFRGKLPAEHRDADWTQP
jgi:hypothetical protein